MGTAVPSTGEMISAGALPLSLSRESSSGGFMRGCWNRMRVSSCPEYPVAPTMADCSSALIGARNLPE